MTRVEVSIRQGFNYTVSVTGKHLPVERDGVTINRETAAVVVEQECQQGGCALREKKHIVVMMRRESHISPKVFS